jgi:L-amino acid N-acyltransferase YncA
MVRRLLPTDAGAYQTLRLEGSSRHPLQFRVAGMYVQERARGGGLTDQLMRALLAEARSQGIEQVILTVAADNDRARRLYQRWGFSIYGTEPRAIKVPDGYLDEVLMVCRLG